MAQAQFDSPYIYPGKPSSTRTTQFTGRKTRAQIVPKFEAQTLVGNTLLEIVHALIIANLLAMSVYASLSFPLLSYAARLLDQLISKFIPLGNGTPKYRQNLNCTTHSEREIQQHFTTKTASLQTAKVLSP